MKKLKDLRVKYISVLTGIPANNKPVVVKSDGFTLTAKVLRKDSREGLLYATVYSPNEVDLQGDWTDEQEIIKAAHQFMEEQRLQMIDFEHNYQPGAGVVVESFIKQGYHKNFDGIRDGSWCVVIKLNDALKERMEEINGISLAGDAISTDERLSEKSHRESPQVLSHVGVLKSRVVKSKVLKP